MKKGRKLWDDIMETPEKRAVEVIKKQLRDRENEERKNRRNNIIVFGLLESKATENEYRKEEDIKQIVGLFKTFAKLTSQRKQSARKSDWRN